MAPTGAGRTTEPERAVTCARAAVPRWASGSPARSIAPTRAIGDRIAAFVRCTSSTQTSSWNCAVCDRTQLSSGGSPPSRPFLSAVTLGELQAGVEITRRQDPTKAEAIEGWIDALTTTHNILPADGVIFRRWGQLMYRKSADLIEDALIAATALVHDMTVATRNVRDFQRLGVPVINPFQRVS